MSRPIRKYPFDNPGKLMQEVQRLIKEDPRSNPELFRDTGIPFNWLNSFVAGKYKNPSVNRMEYLYETLSGKELDL